MARILLAARAWQPRAGMLHLPVTRPAYAAWMGPVAIVLRGCAVLVAAGFTAACTADPSAPAALPPAAATPAATASAAGTHSPSAAPTATAAPKPKPKPT